MQTPNTGESAVKMVQKKLQSRALAPQIKESWVTKVKLALTGMHGNLVVS